MGSATFIINFRPSQSRPKTPKRGSPELLAKTSSPLLQPLRLPRNVASKTITNEDKRSRQDTVESLYVVYISVCIPFRIVSSVATEWATIHYNNNGQSEY